MNQYLKTLEFNFMIEKLKEYAVSEKTKQKIEMLEPIQDLTVARNKIRESAEAKKIMEETGTPPIGSADIVNHAIERAEIGDMLTPDQLEQILYFLTSIKRMKSYLKRSEYLECGIAYMGTAFCEVNDLRETIEKSIRNGEVDPYATSKLRSLTENLEKKREQIKAKLEKLLKTKKSCFTDSYIVQRDGHFVLPVKREEKGRVEGTVYDTSSSGNTVFIEPRAVTKLQGEVTDMEIEQDNEIRRILYELTDRVCQSKQELEQNAGMMEELDFVFAKGKLGMQMGGIDASLTEERRIVIHQGRHPLLNQEECVPLDFEVGGTNRGVIITGPNTGGKTVALKTVGLLSVMAGSGLLVPAAEGSQFTISNHVLCDIGDGQNISESLSTFSAHMKNVIKILEQADSNSLVLLDELGSGTDPAEGMGIAVAILEALKDIGCLVLATTHYPEVKEYAKKTIGMINARMSFDKESLQPLYQLVIGEAGESCALYIARKLGFPEQLITIADKAAYGNLEFGTEQMETGYKKAESKYQKRKIKKKSKVDIVHEFTVGDSVSVPPAHKKGIVSRPVNDSGNVQVQVQGVKQWYPAKRVKLLVKAEDMYPEDYDFSIIFDTVENRKAKHEMGRKYDPGLEVHYDDGEENVW